MAREEEQPGGAVDVSEPVDGALSFEIHLPPRPYPGLRPFEKDEWPIFFGRERMADAVVADVIERRLLVVHGDSGCGKSSLVRAAVLPRLEHDNARGGIRWRTCSTTPGESPLWNLARDLAALVSGRADDERAIEIRRVLNFGRSAPAALAELLGCGANDHVCILIDQFEELFAHAARHGPDEARMMTGFCTALYREPPDGLNVILTMRSEFLGACARFDDFAETVNATQYLLPRMRHDDLLRAIREPAWLYEGEVARDLAERLIADAGGGQDQLPLIQHGLMLLYRDRSPAGGPWTLTLDRYKSDRGLKGLLSDHADAVMAEARRKLPSENHARVIEDLFRALTDINADGQAVRRPQTLARLSAVTGASEPVLRPVIDAFRTEGVSFLRPYGHEPIDSGERIDISHEALIRCWQSLADPKDGWLIREFRNGLVWRALLVQADSFERDPANVLAATTTDEREAWLQRRSAAWAERYGGGWDRVEKLVQASAAARDRDRADEAAAREREERARLRDQRFKYVLGGSIVLGLMLVAAIYFAIQAQIESQRARDQLAEARIEFEKANAARQRSEELAAQTQKWAEELSSLVEELRRGASGQGGGVYTQRAATKAEELAQGLSAYSVVVPSPVDAARVYIHISNEMYRQPASELERALEASKVNNATIAVPGIELVKSAPAQPELRCFRRDECAGEARALLDVVNRLLSEPQLELRDLSARYGSSTTIRPRHYEIWFPAALKLKTTLRR